MKKVSKYQSGKVAAREAAIMWQSELCGVCLSYGELSEAGNTFYNLGKRYGLLREFRTNGIPC